MPCPALSLTQTSITRRELKEEFAGERAPAGRVTCMECGATIRGVA